MPVKPRFCTIESKQLHPRKFTDREDLINIFKNNLTGQRQDEYRILVYYGVGGVGKTTLRKELGKILDDKYPNTIWAVLDFDTPNCRNQEGALFVLRKLFCEKYKIQFPSFDIAYTIFWKKTRPNTPITRETFPLLEQGNLIGDIIALGGDLPIVGIVPKLAMVILRGRKHFQEWWNKRGKKEVYALSELEPNEILERLPMLWADDLKDFIESQKVPAVVFLDTYEALWESMKSYGSFFTHDEWVRELVANLPGILWVFFSREKLRWEEVNSDWSECISQYLVGNLSYEDALELLKAAGVENQEICEKIIASSEGMPYYIDLAIDTYFQVKNAHKREPSPEDFAKTPRKMLDRFLRYLDRSEIETLKVLSAPRFWDYNLFELLVTHFKTGYPLTAFDDLCRFSFIRRDANTQKFSMHEIMQKSIREYLPAELKTQVHRLLFDYYNRQLVGLEVKDIHQNHRVALAEAFYHGKIALEIGDLYEWFTNTSAVFFNAVELKTLMPIYLEMTETIKEKYGDNCPHLITIFNLLGLMYRIQGKYKEAEAFLQQAIKLAKDRQDYLKLLVDATNNLALLYTDEGRYSEAEKLLKQTMAILEGSSEAENLLLFETINNLGLLYRTQGRLDEAEPLLREAVNISREHFGDESPEFAQANSNLAICLRNMGKYKEAESLHLRALEIIKKHYGVDNLMIAICMNNIALLNEDQGKITEAETLYKQAIEIYEKTIGPECSHIAVALRNLGILYRNQKRLDESETHLKRALEIQRHIQGEDNLIVSDYIGSLAFTYRLQGKQKEAEEMMKYALEIKEKYLGTDHYQLLSLLGGLVRVSIALRKNDEAKIFLKRWLEIREKSSKKDIESVTHFLKDISDLYLEAGYTKEAEDIYNQIKTITQKQQNTN